MAIPDYQALMLPVLRCAATSETSVADDVLDDLEKLAPEAFYRDLTGPGSNVVAIGSAIK